MRRGFEGQASAAWAEPASRLAPTAPSTRSRRFRVMTCVSWDEGMGGACSARGTAKVVLSYQSSYNLIGIVSSAWHPRSGWRGAARRGRLCFALGRLLREAQALPAVGQVDAHGRPGRVRIA